MREVSWLFTLKKKYIVSSVVISILSDYMEHFIVWAIIKRLICTEAIHGKQFAEAHFQARLQPYSSGGEDLTINQFNPIAIHRSIIELIVIRIFVFKISAASKHIIYH